MNALLPVSCVGRSVPSQISSTCSTCSFLYSPKSALASLIFPSQLKTVSRRSKKSINALHLASCVGRSVPSQVSSTGYPYGPESQHALHPVCRIRSCSTSPLASEGQFLPRSVQQGICTARKASMRSIPSVGSEAATPVLSLKQFQGSSDSVTFSRPCVLLLLVGKRYLSKLLVHKNTKKEKRSNHVQG